MKTLKFLTEMSSSIEKNPKITAVAVIFFMRLNLKINKFMHFESLCLRDYTIVVCRVI